MFNQSRTSTFAKESYLLRLSVYLTSMLLFMGTQINQSLYAQISTAVTMSGTPISGSPFTSFSAAVTAVNGLVITGPVVMHLTAAQSETLTSKITMTATGTSSNTITIKKSGSGAKPKLIGYTGISAIPQIIGDGMLVFAGTDYMTLDSVDFEENPANTTTITQMEFAIAFAKQSGTDGCQFNTVKNCVIKLNRLNNANWIGVGHTGSCGIVFLNTLHNALGTVIVTSPSGSHSFNKLQSNTIQNCNAGIVYVAFGATAGVGPNPDPTRFLGDLGNEIGGSPATGNSILNFGGSGGAANPSSGIFANHQWSMKVTHNIINNNDGSGVNHPNILRGLFFNSSSSSANLTCTNNVVTIRGGGTSSQVTGIESVFGANAAANKINISNNTVNMEYLTATTGVCYGIWNSASADTVWIANNVINPFNYSGATLKGSGEVNGIRNSDEANNVFVLNNQVLGINRTGVIGGRTVGIDCISGGNQVVKNNIIKNLIITGTGTSSTMNGINTTSNTVVVDSNTITNLQVAKITGTDELIAINNVNASNNENFNFNTIDSLIHLGPKTNTIAFVYGIFIVSNQGNRIISNNKVSNIFSNMPNTGGIGQRESTTLLFNNLIRNITSFNTTSSCAVDGIKVLSGASITAYNNFVSNISAPFGSSENAVCGINISSTQTPANLYFNTIKLDSSGNNLQSTGTNFGGSGIFLNSATSAFDLKNNYISVKGVPNGSGSFAAIRRIGVAGSVNIPPANITWASNVLHTNSNASNFLYVEGSTLPAGFGNATSIRNGYNAIGVADFPVNNIVLDPSFNSSCSLFKQWKSCVNCFTENNLTATTPVGTFVPSSPSLAQNSAVEITNPNINFDFSNTSRAGLMDIGAKESSGTANDLAGPQINVTSIPGMLCTAQPTLTAEILDASGVATSSGRRPRVFYRKTSDPDTFVTANNSSAPGWKWVEASNTTSPFKFIIDYSKFAGGVAVGNTIQYFVVAQDIVATPNVSLNSAILNPALICLDSVNLPAKAGLTNAVGSRSYAIDATPSSQTLLSPNPLTSCFGDTISHLVIIKAGGSIPSGYCASTATDPDQLEIDSVSFGTIQNRTACSLTGTQGVATGTADLYSNFTTSAVPVPDLYSGSTYPLTVRTVPYDDFSTCTPGFGGINSTVAFIDWNRDGDFNDAQEKYILYSNQVFGQTATINISVPAFAVAGKTVMRISNREGNPFLINPCHSAASGETEDYTVNIIAPIQNASHSWTSNKTGTAVLGTDHPFKHVSTADTTIYRDSINYFGCSFLVFDTVKLNPLPKKLRTFNSVQCGAGVPPLSFKVRDSNGYASPIIGWYSSLTSTSPLQMSTDTVYTSTIASTTTLYVSVRNPTTGCWSQRVPITLTVNTSDSIVGRANGVRDTINVCAGSPINLTAVNVQMPAFTKSFDTFIWTSNNSNSGISSPIRTVNGNYTFTPTIGGNYQLYVNARDTGTGCGAIDTIKLVVNSNPFVGTTKKIEIVPNPACIGTNVSHTFLLEQNTSPLPTGYCASTASVTDQEEIDSVSFGTIQNRTFCGLIGSQGTATGAPDLYSDFTASMVPVPDVITGNTYPLTVRTVTYDDFATCNPGFGWGDNSTVVFFDWNHDGDFIDTLEKQTVYEGLIDGQSVTVNVRIPSFAKIGKTVMRISNRQLATAAAIGPCHVQNQGETEDYAINIKGVPLGTSFSWASNQTAAAVLGTSNPLVHALPAANTIYTLRLMNGACVDSFKDTVTNGGVAPFVIAPISGSTTACFGEPILLRSGASGGCIPYTYNWFVVGGSGGTFTGIGSLNNDSIFFNPSGPSGLRTVRVVVTGSSGIKDSSTHVINFSNPQPIAIVSDTVCGVQSATLSATPSPAANLLRWYNSPISYQPLAEGNTFITPMVSTNTKFYIRQFNSIMDSAGALGTTIASSNTVPMGLRMSVNNKMIINSAEIYPFGAPNSSGTISMELRDQFGTTLETIDDIPFSYNTGGTVATTLATATPVTIPLGFLVQPGNDYEIVVTKVSGANFVHRNLVFPSPYPLNSASGSFSITGGIDLGGPTMTQHFYLFNLKAEQGCWGEPVMDSVHFMAPPSLALSRRMDSICSLGSTSSVSLINPIPTSIYNTYAWTPNTNVSGSIAAGYTFSQPNPGEYSYVLRAAQTGGQQCVNTDTFKLKVKPIPGTFAISPAGPLNLCNGSVRQLNAQSYEMSSSTLGTDNNFGIGDGESPFQQNLGGTKAQYIIHASELAGAGLSASSMLRSLSLNVASIGNDYEGFQIWVGHTTLTDYGAGHVNADTATLTKVYEAAATNAAYSPTLGTNQFVFGTGAAAPIGSAVSDKFVWDGVSNLLVVFSWSENPLSFFSFGSLVEYSTLPFVASAVRQSNNLSMSQMLSGTAGGATRVGISSNRPNMVLGFENRLPMVWSPVTGLFNNSGASSAYVSAARDTVWASHNDTIKYYAMATHSNGCTLRDSIVLNIKDTVKINTQPPAFIAFCQGDTMRLSVASSSSSPMTYQWKKNTLNISTALNSSAATNVLVIPNVTQSDSGVYEVEITTGSPCGSKTSIQSVVKVRLPITMTAQPKDTTVCFGAPFALSASSINDSSRIWTQIGGTNTGTTNVLSKGSSVFTDSGRYYIRYIPKSPCPVKNSDTVRVRILSPAQIVTDPVALTNLCIGDSVTLKATYTGALSFQWLKNGSLLSGKTADSIRVKANTRADSGEYRLVVYSSSGCLNDTTSVNTGVVKVNLPINITTPPLTNTFVCQNSPFNANITAQNVTSYQWKKGGVNVSTGTGGTTSNYSIASTQSSDNGVYTVEMTGNSPCPNVTSTANTLAVTTLATITTSPTAFQVCEDQSISITGSASNVSSYRWLLNGSPIASPNGTAQTYTKGGSPATMADSGRYRLVALSANAGATTCKADTSAEVLGAVVRKIQITTQPLINTFVCQNSVFNTSVVAQNATGYQWKKGGVNVSTGTGGTTSNYSIASAQPSDNGVYTVEMTGNSPCPNVTSTANTLAVTTLATVTTSPTAFQVCEDQSISITGSASNVSSYRWLLNGSPIASPNGTAQTYTKGGSPATMADSGRYRLVALSANAGATTCKADTSAEVLGAVLRKIQITTQPLTNTFVCQNSVFNASVVAQNATGYQWKKGGVNVSTGTGGTTSNYSIASTQLSDNGVYTVEMTGNSPCPNVTSTANTLAVTTLATITTSPIAFQVCEDQSISITGSASNVSSYRWLLNGSPIASPNGTAQTYTKGGSPATMADSGRYRLVALSANAGATTCKADTSAEVLGAVVRKIQITTQPPALSYGCINANFSMSIVAKNVTGYSWLLGGTPIGQTTATMSITPFTTAVAGNYSVVMSGNSPCPNVTSDNAKVDPTTAAVITKDPTSIYKCLGSNLTLNVAADAAVSYQWRKNGVNILGATGSSYSIPSLVFADSGTYDVIALAVNGCTNDTSMGAVVSIKAPLAITTSLANTDVKCEGQNINYTIGVSGDGPFTYTWLLNGSMVGMNSPNYAKTGVLVADSGRYVVNIQGSVACPAIQDTIDLDVNKAPQIVMQPNGSSPVCLGSNIVLSAGVVNYTTIEWHKQGLGNTGQTGAVYTSLGSKASDGGDYYVIAKAQPACSDMVSSIVNIIVNVPVSISSQPQGAQLLEQPAGSHTLSVTASGTGPLSYQWYKNGALIVGATSSTYSIINYTGTADSGNYYCKVMAPAPCSNSVNSNTARITTAKCPSVVNQPTKNISICAGEAFSLDVTAGGVKNYQWFKGNTPISGATFANFSIPNADPSHSGIYRCRLFAYNDAVCDITYTDSAVIVVKDQPIITKQPLGMPFCAASSHEMTVEATYGETYQWYRNGIAISPGGDGPSYTYNNINLIGDEFYVVVGNNLCSDTTSNKIVLKKVNPSSQVYLTGSTVFNLVERCEDANGWTYYSTSAQSEQLLMAIKKNGNNFTAKPDIELMGSIREISPINKENRGALIGSTIFNLDIQGSVVNPYELKFFYSKADADLLMNRFSQIRTANSGNFSTDRTDLTFILSTQRAFNSALWNNMTIPINFEHTISHKDKEFGTENNVNYVVLKQLVSPKLGGTMFMDYKLKSSSSIHSTNPSGFGFSMYPVPTTDGKITVDVSSKKMKPVTFTVMDMTGRVVAVFNEKHTSMESSHAFDFSQLSNGNYQMMISNDEESAVGKFIIER